MHTAYLMNAGEFSSRRTALGFSQAAIATALGVDQGTISRWESGKVRIPAAIELALEKLKENRQPMPDSSRPRILIADPVAPEGIELLRGIGEVEVHTGQSPEQ